MACASSRKMTWDLTIAVKVGSFCVKAIASTEDNPCELFDSLRFPLDEFFPPQRSEFEDIDNRHHKHC